MAKLYGNHNRAERQMSKSLYEHMGAGFKKAFAFCVSFDEEKAVVFDGLYYSTERAEWRARCHRVNPEDPSFGQIEDLSHAQVIGCAERLKNAGITASQSLKACQAFGAKIDRETAKLTCDFH